MVKIGLARISNPPEVQSIMGYWGSMVIEAVPGAGKTELLSRLIVRDLKSGVPLSDMLVSGFTRNTVRTIEDRLGGLVENLPTLHGQRKRSLGLAFSGDFNDMLVEYQEGREKRFSHVYLDELEDFDYSKFGVALSLLEPGGVLVAVLDPYQAIFGYAGSVPNPVEDLIKSYGCRHFYMSRSYRCSEEIVRGLEVIFPRGLRPKPNRGLVSWGSPTDFENLLVLVRYRRTVRHIYEWLKSRGVKSNMSLMEDDERFWSEDVTTYIKTIHRARSGEADRVWLIDWSVGDPFGEERNVYYVGMSRARNELYISNFGEVSPFTLELLDGGVL